MPYLSETAWWCLVLLITYTYVGYPLLLLLVCRLRPGAENNDDFAPSVSVIIAAHNEEGCIGARIENLLRQSYPRDCLQILVAANGCTDETDSAVRAYAAEGVQLVSLSEPGKTNAQNAAVEAATGEIVVFTDADAVYEPETVRLLVRNFADPRVGLVQGDTYLTEQDGVPVGEGNSAYMRYERLIKQLESRLGASVTGYGGILAMRRSLYQPLPAHLMEDFALPVLALAQGHRTVFDAEARMYEKSRQTATDEFMVRARVASQDALACLALLPRLLRPSRILPLVLLISHKPLRWLVPFFLAVLFGLSIALASLPFYRFGLGAQIAFYLLAACGHIFRVKAGRAPLLYLPLYFCLVNCAAAFGVLGMLMGDRKVTWQRAESSR